MVWANGEETLMNGASLTDVTVIVKVCGALVSTPPFAVPPVSLSTIVTSALPDTFALSAYDNEPLLNTAGCCENKPGLVLLVT